jgi:predicted deacylase
VRARRGGLLRLDVEEGDRVAEKQILGTVSDPFGDERNIVRAPFAGLVIGKTRNPVVHGGDAMVHLGRIGPRPRGKGRVLP